MKQEEIIINIEENEWEEIPIPPEVIYKYKGRFLSFRRTLPSGAWEMRYCDERENILPNSPVIIRTHNTPHGTVDSCVRIVD